jgi:hypothetical protein
MTAVAITAAPYAPAHHALAPEDLTTHARTRASLAPVVPLSPVAPSPGAPSQTAPSQTAPSTAPPGAPIARPRVIPAAYAKRGPLGDPTPLVCTVAKAALEIALGADGINHLARWITPTLRTTLLRQQSLSRRAGYAARGEVSVARVRLCRVSATAVETAVVATEGEVAHALAMRLEAVSGRWLVTALDVG